MILSNIISIIVSLLVLGVLVIGHEAGHFFMGKILGFQIEEFAIGFGPKLVNWTKNGTLYSIRLLPLGGFVRFLGEEQLSTDRKAFNNQSVWKRILVIVTGPVMNIVLAVVLAIFVLVGFGDYFPIPVIGEIVDKSPAQVAGLKVGDSITEINNIPIKTYNDVIQTIQKNKGKTLSISVKRSTKIIKYNLSPYYDINTKTSRIGIVLSQEKRKVGLWDGIKLSIQWVYNIITLMLDYLGKLFFHGQGVNDIMGPVGTIGLIGQAAEQGFERLIRLAILITLNLGIVNLLPIPALDGGRLLFLFLEGIRGKPLSQDREGYIHFAGFVILLLLMLLFTYKDIVRFFAK